MHVIYTTQLLTVVFVLTHHQNAVPGNMIGSKKFGAQNYLRRKEQTEDDDKTHTKADKNISEIIKSEISVPTYQIHIIR